MRAVARSILVTVVLFSGCHKMPMMTSAAPPSPAAAEAPPPPSQAVSPAPPASVTPAATPLLAAVPPRPPMMAAGPVRIQTVMGAGHRAARNDASPATASPGDDDAQVLHAWYGKLPQGWVRYTVPSPMVMERQYSASAYIPAVGSALAASAADPGKTKTADKSIKVAAYMRVALAAPDDPDGFTITPPAQACKFISQDGDTRWDFTVTPHHAGMNKQLTFTTSVLYGNGADACDPNNVKTIAVTTDTEAVQVNLLPGTRGMEHAAAESVVKDPGKWVGYLKYILPGGAIFTFIAGIVRWWQKRRAADKGAA